MRVTGNSGTGQAYKNKTILIFLFFCFVLFSFRERGCNTGGDYFRVAIEFLFLTVCVDHRQSLALVSFFSVPAGLRGNDIDDDDGSSVLYLFSVGWSGVLLLFFGFFWLKLLALLVMVGYSMQWAGLFSLSLLSLLFFVGYILFTGSQLFGVRGGVHT